MQGGDLCNQKAIGHEFGGSVWWVTGCGRLAFQLAGFSGRDFCIHVVKVVAFGCFAFLPFS